MDCNWSEKGPGGSEADRAKFGTRKDRALTTIVLLVDTLLVGDPEDPAVIRSA